MRRLKLYVISWLSILLLMGAYAYSMNLDHIVAVVNDDVITRSELDKELAGIVAQLRKRQIPLPPQETLERQVLERMIGNRLQLQAAKQLGLQVDDATVDKAVASIAAKNKLSLVQLRDTLESEGVNFAQFREHTRQQVLLLRLRAKEVLNRVNLTDQEVELFLRRNQGQLSGREAVHLQHILIATPDGATPSVIQKARDKVERVLQQLRAGADFAQTALITSEGRQALEGGDLGWMPLSQVPTIAAEAAKTLKPDEISAPIRSASGFHIFRLAAVKGGNRQVVTQTHARHILLRTSELVSDQEAKTRLSQLLIRLTGGEKFAILARSHSDDTASAIKGGDLGWINPGDTVPAFEEQMTNLSPTETSQPFRSPFGWHIVQVLGRRTLDNTENTLKSKARENLHARKASEAAELWLRRLRDEAYVEIRLRRHLGIPAS